MKKDVLENVVKFTGKHLFCRTPPDDCLCFYHLRSNHQSCYMEKGVLENFPKFTGKHLYRTPLDDCFWLFCATLLKWGTVNSVCKTSDEYSLSRNTNLRSTSQVYHFFFRQNKLSVYVFIGLRCLLPEGAIRVELFYKARCS